MDRYPAVPGSDRQSGRSRSAARGRGLSGLVRSSFTDTAAALVLVAVIVAVAVVGDRAAGFLATVSATVWFDFFLTRPYEQLAITHRADIQTAVSLFVVGMIVTELAVRNRRHQESAIEESDYVGLIYQTVGAGRIRCTRR